MQWRYLEQEAAGRGRITHYFIGQPLADTCMRLVNSETLQLYKRLLVYARPYYKALGLGSLLAALSAATEPLLPALMKPMLDDGFKFGEQSPLI